MAPSAPLCDTCSAAIPDSDFESGNAVSVLGKSYCPRCKGEAVRKISLDDLVAVPGGPKPAAPKPPARAASPAPRPKGPTPSPKTAADAPRPAVKAPAAKPPVAARRPQPAASNSKPIVIIAGVVVALGAVVGGLMIFRGGGTPAPPATSGGSGSSSPPAAALTPEHRDTQAEHAYNAPFFYHGRGDSPETVLAAIEKARPKCAGTQWEAKLDELRMRVLRDQEARDASRSLTPIIDELKAGVAADRDFQRFGELQTRFLAARDLAARSGSRQMAEIQEIQSAYRDRYEEAAQPFYDKIDEAARVLAEERRYDDALKRIDAFPAHLRLSRQWKSLERMKEDIEKRRNLQPKK